MSDKLCTEELFCFNEHVEIAQGRNDEGVYSPSKEVKLLQSVASNASETTSVIPLLYIENKSPPAFRRMNVNNRHLERTRVIQVLCLVHAVYNGEFFLCDIMIFHC